MAELANQKSVAISKIISDIDAVKFNPSGIQRKIFDTLDEIQDGRTVVMDATSPFAFSISSMAVNTAVAIQEMTAISRKLYPSLNQTDDDLYLHMSDKDFLDRFATPLDVDFTFMVPMNDIRNKMVMDPVENVLKAIIPRDTSVTVNETVFTMQYPIVIRLYNNGTIKVSYDADVVSPIRVLNTNIIQAETRTTSDGTTVLMFTVPFKQYGIRSIFEPAQKGIYFSKNVEFVDQFCFARVFYRNDQTGNRWKEMVTTHTDQVFDTRVPTASLKVFESSVNVSIQPVYMTTELVSGDIRVDVYSTKGEITMNMASYQLSMFQVQLAAIDQERDLNAYTAAMTGISFAAFNAAIVSGGKSSISYEALRQRVINNSNGDVVIPITNVQIAAEVQNAGFELIKNVDVVTNRIFLAAKDLPKPLNTDLLTSANIGILTYINSVDYLTTLDTVANNGDRITLFSNNLFENVNGILKVLTTDEINALKTLPGTALVATVNERNFVYTPFYYVLDNTDREFSLRAYHLDKPGVDSFSFVSQNETLQMSINTGVYEIKKVMNGYELWIMTKSDASYKNVPEGMMQLQLAVKPDGENNFAYLNGEYQFTNSENERAYRFTLLSNHDIDSEDLLTLTNFNMFANNNPAIKVKLLDEFHLFYTTTSVNDEYVPSSDDQLTGKFMLPAGAVSITHERFRFSLGQSLKNLWSRSRSLATGLDYQRHDADVPMLYTQVVYEKDPVTGSIILGFGAEGKPYYNIAHQIGDPVLDESGAQIYKHRLGEPVLDADGNPVVVNELSVIKEFDLLMVDGKYFFATDLSFVNYRSELVDVLKDWIVDDLIDIQRILLENTKIYFYPKTTIGSVVVNANGTPEQRLNSEQSLKLDLYVSDSIFKSIAVRREIEKSAAILLDEALSQRTINMNTVTEELKTSFGDSVRALSISGLGGSKNFTLVQVNNQQNRLCLRKKLELQPDDNFIITEDIEIEFHNIDDVN